MTLNRRRTDEDSREAVDGSDVSVGHAEQADDATHAENADNAESASHADTADDADNLGGEPPSHYEEDAEAQAETSLAYDFIGV